MSKSVYTYEAANDLLIVQVPPSFAAADTQTSGFASNFLEGGKVSGRSDGVRSVFMTDVCSHLVEGLLKGWDQLLNLVMDDVEELVRGRARNGSTSSRSNLTIRTAQILKCCSHCIQNNGGSWD